MSEICERCFKRFADTSGMRVCDECLEIQASPSDGVSCLDEQRMYMDIDMVQADIDSWALVEGGVYLEAVI